MALFCMLMPGIVFCYMLEKQLHFQHQSGRTFWQRILAEYIMGLVVVNSIMIEGWVLTNHSGNILFALDQYSNFAVKYILGAVALAAIIPILYVRVRSNCMINVQIRVKQIAVPDWAKVIGSISIAVFFAILHLIRCFDNSFWGDEGITIVAARKGWGEMLKYVADNGHSPFQYAFTWLMWHLFGDSGLLFHLASALPYFLILVIAVSIVRKWFGCKAAIVLMSFSSLLGCAVTYNLEVRMYAWCEFFVLMAYLMAYGVYTYNEKTYYVALSLFSLGAVYSHYFSLASIGIIYAFLFFFMLIKRKTKNLVGVVLSGGSVLLFLLPWVVYAIKMRGNVILNYNLGRLTWSECFEFIFHSKNSWVFLAAFFVTLLLSVLIDSKIFEIKKNAEEKYLISLNVFPSVNHLSVQWFWILSGLCSVFGTIVLAQVFSAVFFPIALLRYLYVCYVIAWLIFGIVISKLYLSRVLSGLLVIITFCTCWEGYYQTVTMEKINNSRLKSTLEATISIDEDDFIYTDIVFVEWTIADVYYPSTKHGMFGRSEWIGPAELPLLDDSYTNWLFLSESISDDICDNLLAQGKKAELVVNNGFIGTSNVYIYRVNTLMPEREG